jgi:hypothetical protein
MIQFYKDVSERNKLHKDALIKMIVIEESN